MVRDGQRAEARVAKESWWRATELEWASPGFGAWQDDRLMGYVMVAPAAHLEGAARFGRVTEDALLLANLWVADDANESVARALVDTALQVAAAKGARALEAFASPSGRDPCVPAESILRACGFSLLRAGFPYPLYRLDLRQTVRWKEGVEEVLAGLARVLRGRRLGRVPSMPSVSSVERS